jgi:hypothetical protein
VNALRRLWARIRPFNIHTDRSDRATAVAFDEMIHANYPRKDRTCE